MPEVSSESVTGCVDELLRIYSTNLHQKVKDSKWDDNHSKNWCGGNYDNKSADYSKESKNEGTY